MRKQPNNSSQPSRPRKKTPPPPTTPNHSFHFLHCGVFLKTERRILRSLLANRAWILAGRAMPPGDSGKLSSHIRETDPRLQSFPSMFGAGGNHSYASGFLTFQARYGNPIGRNEVIKGPMRSCLEIFTWVPLVDVGPYSLKQHSLGMIRSYCHSYFSLCSYRHSTFIGAICVFSFCLFNGAIGSYPPSLTSI